MKIKKFFLQIKYRKNLDSILNDWIKSLKSFKPIKNSGHLDLRIIKYKNHHHVIESKDLVLNDDIKFICKYLKIVIEEYKIFVL